MEVSNFKPLTFLYDLPQNSAKRKKKNQSAEETTTLEFIGKESLKSMVLAQQLVKHKIVTVLTWLKGLNSLEVAKIMLSSIVS